MTLKQASIMQDAMSPDLEAAAKAFDKAAADYKSVQPPPEGHASWTAALKAWTDWHGDAGEGSESAATGTATRTGAGGRVVPVDAARGLLALGRYRINWNFDDWHGYTAERRRFLAAVVPRQGGYG
jgi:alkaline phosphatase D